MALSPLLARLKARAVLLAQDLRVDVSEAAAVYAEQLAGVDLLGVGEHDDDEREPETPSPVTPLETLEATTGVVVSRDFREAGRGAKWDRVRDYDTAIYGWPRSKERGQARGVLPWSRVSTIVLHTAGVQGLHPDRWLGVPCHTAVADDATVVLCHELNSYLWAAHAANRHSCSLEVAGDRTITDAQIVAARALLTYMAAELRRRRPRGPKGEVLPVYVAPHRFSHSSRAVDCDHAIWGQVGEWGIAKLGLRLGPVVGSGRPLPFPR